MFFYLGDCENFFFFTKVVNKTLSWVCERERASKNKKNQKRKLSEYDTRPGEFIYVSPSETSGDRRSCYLRSVLVTHKKL